MRPRASGDRPLRGEVAVDVCPETAVLTRTRWNVLSSGVGLGLVARDKLK